MNWTLHLKKGLQITRSLIWIELNFVSHRTAHSRCTSKGCLQESGRLDWEKLVLLEDCTRVCPMEISKQREFCREIMSLYRQTYLFNRQQPFFLQVKNFILSIRDLKVLISEKRHVHLEKRIIKSILRRFRNAQDIIKTR